MGWLAAMDRNRRRFFRRAAGGASGFWRPSSRRLALARERGVLFALCHLHAHIVAQRLQRNDAVLFEFGRRGRDAADRSVCLEYAVKRVDCDVDGADWRLRQRWALFTDSGSPAGAGVRFGAVHLYAI